MSFVLFQPGFNFFLLSCRTSLCILDIKPLSDIGCKYVSPFYRQPLHSINCFLFCAECFGVIQSYLFIFVFVGCAFGVISMQIYKSIVMKRSPCIFFLGSFIVSGLTFKCLMYFQLIFSVWCKICVQIHSFAYDCRVSPAMFVEKTIFSLLCIPGTFVKDQMTFQERIYFWILCSVPPLCFSVYAGTIIL